MGEAQWYLGMQIKQYADRITLDQSQYAKNVTSRLEKAFKNVIKMQDSPLPTSFVPTKKDCPQNVAQTAEVKKRFQNLHYRSAIGSLLRENKIGSELLDKLVGSLNLFILEPLFKLSVIS